MTAAPPLEFRLLGPLAALIEGRPISLGGDRQRTLLVLLLLRANEAVSRDRLIDDLWGSEPPATSGNALAAIVARLRRVLPGEVLLTTQGGYELSIEPEPLEAVEVERLRLDAQLVASLRRKQLFVGQHSA